MKNGKKPNVVATLPKNSLVSVEVLAYYLNCNVESLKKWIQRNEVKYRVVNGKWLVDVDSIIEP